LFVDGQLVKQEPSWAARPRRRTHYDPPTLRKLLTQRQSLIS